MSKSIARVERAAQAAGLSITVKRMGESTRTAEAKTAYGICGVKVWIFKGEILEHDPMASEKRQIEGQEQGGGGGGRRQNA